MAHRLLHVEASPRREAAVSTMLAAQFIQRFRGVEPGLDVDRLHIWEEQLPDLHGALLSAKYGVLSGRDLDSAEAGAWKMIASLIERVRRADSILVSTPIWNFGIPYRLKHWIDLITQPGLSFAFDPQSGYRPLLLPRPVTVILTSSGDYSAGPSWGRPDLASGYLREAFRFIGIGEPEIVLAGPTAGEAARQRIAREDASEQLDARVAAHWKAA